MPVLVNPYLSFGGGSGAVDLTDPWEEIDRTSTLASGTLVLAGYDFSGIAALQIIVSGVTITTDDSTVEMRFYIAGSEISSGYQWELSMGNSAGTTAAPVSASDDSIVLTDTTATRMLGNVSTEAFGAVITIYDPGSALHKRCRYTCGYGQAVGEVARIRGSGELANSGALTGVVLMGSTNLTGGTIVLLGLE
jgi:hypothetical protein